jgi:sec-independent protein translocase protein TatA
MEALGPWHLLLILVGFIVLFGYKKLPDASRSLGRSLRIFKSEMQSMGDDHYDRPPATAGASLETARTAAELEAEAAAAEAHAVELRIRAQTHPPGDVAS